MFHSAFILLASSTFASAETTDLDNQLLETPPIYFAARAALAVPANANGDVLTAGPSLGVQLDEMNTLGIRVIYMKDPPDNPLASDTPSVPWATAANLHWLSIRTGACVIRSEDARRPWRE